MTVYGNFNGVIRKHAFDVLHRVTLTYKFPENIIMILSVVFE